MVEIPDMNQVIANNIVGCLSAQNKRLDDLADVIGVPIKDIKVVLNGFWPASTIELGKIAECLGVSTEVLAQLPDEPVGKYRILSFMGRLDANSRNALAVADKLSDLCLFHARIRENGTQMFQPLER